MKLVLEIPPPVMLCLVIDVSGHIVFCGLANAERAIAFLPGKSLSIAKLLMNPPR